MNAPQQASSSSSLIVRLVMTVLPRSWRNHNLQQELWFHVRPPFSFDPTVLPSPVGRVPCRGSQKAGAQARPAARDTSGFDDDEAQHGSGSVNRGRGADVDENAEGDSRRQGVHSGNTRRFLMTDSDAAGLEARLKIVEDKLAIYELIASHPPSADTGSADYTSSVYLEDGVFDRGPTLDGATGVENIAAFTLPM